MYFIKQIFLFMLFFKNDAKKNKIIYLLFTCLLMQGCASDQGNKTPVKGLLKYCNSYYVRGSWHYPQRYYEYDETGLASWYGPGFHGKPKPCGEPFNQNAMTAAHKTLPLPCVARVTNLANGKSVVVVIDDRGPFVYDGRIIDLSMAAAKAIGTYSKGIGTVRVETMVEESKSLCTYLVANGNKNGKCKDNRTWEQVYLNEVKGDYNNNHVMIAQESPNKIVKKNIKKQNIDKILDEAASPPSPSLTNKNITQNNLQNVNFVKTPSQFRVNSGKVFFDKDNAQKLLNKIQTKYPGQIKQVSNPNGQKLYNVIIGPFKNGDLAKKAISDLAQMGHNGAIIVKN
jgi:rare lipoprotein A